MNMIKGIYLVIILILIGCQAEEKKETITQKEGVLEMKTEPFKYWTWITANQEKTDEEYTTEFKKYKNNGIDAVLINTFADPKILEKLTQLAVREELEVHAWMFTMNRPDDKIALQHPDWYMVSRSGKSCFDDRPYVDYYQWLSPSHPEARQHVWDLVEGLAKVKDVASVHLDYIRYPDVYLPVGLLPKYNLVQNEELPDFDFDYSKASVEKFERLYGKDIRQSEVPAIDIEWKQFRLNEIKAVVDGAYEIAHKHGKKLTAAVFPYPEMADHMVRQRWDKWNVDEVLPMIYYNFYNETVDWVGFATRQGVADLKGKNTKLHTGIYLPPMSAKDVSVAIELAKNNGASGVSFFDGEAITDEQFAVIKSSKNN
ncbi:family 10 glycosylhydrolase [Aquimarina sp. D1M17]|uniref:family 10 glycosylhydrolase n=1 Tax=Aquimarina acroporae TaxID=2937283 RepID=UPI0020C13665|nr:family 10 glycosylhydrolase [Aquimarina acroporae]MCK8520989.1 family 10 glycosylhydrolase [Aquimarina acroporae]